MAKQEAVKSNSLSLQKTDQPILVTSDRFLKKYYSEDFETKYSQDDGWDAKALYLKIQTNCTLETLPLQSRNIIINVHGKDGKISNRWLL